MKRFYCTVCKRIKRVQKWPEIIEAQDSIVVKARQGECNRHSGNRVTRTPHPNPRVKQVTLSVSKTQNKRKAS